MFRDLLLKNQYPIRVGGAGSKGADMQAREIRDIVRSAAVSPSVGRYLFRTVLYQEPGSILEVGTSLGISTLYLRMAARVSPFITLESSAELALEARNNLFRMGCADVEVATGHLSTMIAKVLPRFALLDLAYWGRGQQSGAGYANFEACLEKAGPGSIFIIAEIHASDDMEACWTRMRAHPRVRASLDVFSLGFLFFDDRLRHPIHVDFVPWYIKPWRSGIFH